MSSLNPPVPIDRRKIRQLHFLDGIRGMSSVYVVLSHLYIKTGLPIWALWLTKWTAYGHYAVAIFITLSGYCLMLPVIQSEDGKLRGGSWDYIRRRALRILPPYYVAITIGLIPYYLNVRNDNGIDWGNVISHYFLVHNFVEKWNHGLVGATWSVAMEWQIYFLLPFLFLPLWQRRGIIPVVITGFLLGYLPHFILPEGKNFEWACPWYIGLFTLGMAAAEVNFSRKESILYWRNRIPWGLLATALFAAFVAWTFIDSEYVLNIYYAPDFLFGLFSLCFLIAMAESSILHKENPGLLVRIFSSKVAIFLGAMSYSLYLSHGIVHAFARWYILKKFHDPAIIIPVYWFLLVPLDLAVGYLFYLCFEKPVVQMKKKKTGSPNPVEAPNVEASLADAKVAA